MPQDVTVTFKDGSTHVYQDAPDNLTPDQAEQRAQKDFGKPVASLSRGVAAPEGKGILAEMGGAFTGAVDKLKADVKQSYADTTARAKAGPANPADFVKNSVHDIGQTGNILLDAVNVPLSPLAGAMHHTVVAPAANALSNIPMQAYVPGKVGADGKPIPMDRDQTRAAWEGAINNALIATKPGPAGGAARVVTAAKPNAVAEMATRFDRAGVTPMVAASGGKGSSAVVNAVAENPIAGIAVRSRLRNAVAQTSDAAGSIAKGYGETRGPQITGENVQSGVKTFAQDKKTPGTFAAKSSATYDDVFGKLDQAMAGKTDPGRMQPVADDQFAHTTAVGGSEIATPKATEVLTQIRGGTQSASVGDLISDPTLSKVARTLESANQAKDLSFNDLRRLRTWTRDAQQNPELRNSIGPANLKRMESALTDDIYTNAETLGSPQLAHQLRRADQYYAAGSQRIEDALAPFAGSKSGESAYARVTQAAGSTASADAQRLLSLKRSLKPEEWGDVAANSISELGKQTAGNAPAGEQGFSVSSFVTNYNKLSPRGKDILFGATGGGGAKATQLRAALDNLATVADDLKGVEKGANASKSAVSAQAVGTVAGLLNPHTTVPMSAALSSMALTGEMLTNPLVVRWLSKTAGAAKTSPAAVRVVVRQLGNASKANAALAPLYQESLKLLSPPRLPAATPTTAEERRTPPQ